MIRLIIFAIVSILGGLGYYFFALPKLPESQILYRLLNWVYQKIWINYHLSTNEFFIYLSILITIFIFLFLEIIYQLNKEKPLTSRGSASWATKKDVKELMKSDGVPVGRFNGKILRINKSHLVTCAGTRSGKGVGAIIPTLLEYPNSLVCLDIKGENFAVTANRRKDFGKVFVLNPFNILGIKTNSYNWLDSIDLNDHECSAKALKIASSLVGGNLTDTSENHFNEQASRLLQGVILLVCGEKQEKRNIITVADLILTVPIDKLCELMKIKGDLAFGTVGKIGAQFLNNANEREVGSILSTAQRAVNFLDNPSVKDTLEKSDFNIAKLPDQIMSIYLIVPADKVADFKPYIRVFFELAFSSIASRREVKGKYEVLFLLDEVAQLGYMDSFPKMVTLLRGMGAQIWLFFQSIAQIKSIYGKESGTILGNSSQIFYGCNDEETPQLISRALGKQTIKEYDPDSKKAHLIARDLLTSDEVRKLKPDTPIILISGEPPIKVKRLCYYKDKEYKELYDKNPYFE